MTRLSSEPRMAWDFWPLELPEDISGSEPSGDIHTQVLQVLPLCWNGGRGRWEPGHRWGHGDGRQEPFCPQRESDQGIRESYPARRACCKQGPGHLRDTAGLTGPRGAGPRAGASPQGERLGPGGQFREGPHSGVGWHSVLLLVDPGDHACLVRPSFSRLPFPGLVALLPLPCPLQEGPSSPLHGPQPHLCFPS